MKYIGVQDNEQADKAVKKVVGSTDIQRGEKRAIHITGIRQSDDN